MAAKVVVAFPLPRANAALYCRHVAALTRTYITATTPTKTRGLGSPLLAMYTHDTIPMLPPNTATTSHQ